MLFAIHIDQANRNAHYRDGQFPIALLLTEDEARRLICQADYTASIAVCPQLRELQDAWEEFQADVAHNAAPAVRDSSLMTHHSSLPLVRTGPGGAYTRDYPAEQLAGAPVEAVAELGGQLNVVG